MANPGVTLSEIERGYYAGEISFREEEEEVLQIARGGGGGEGEARKHDPQRRRLCVNGAHRAKREKKEM